MVGAVRCGGGSEKRVDEAMRDGESGAWASADKSKYVGAA